MSEVMQRTGFLETLSPMAQTATKSFGTRLVINAHVYLFKETTDRWSDAELDDLIARNVISKKTPLRNRGHFVCEVTDPEDYESILSISAGYRPYDEPRVSKRAPPQASTIPNTRETPVSSTRKAPTKKGKASTTTPRPGKAPDAPAPAYTGPDPAAG